MREIIYNCLAIVLHIKKFHTSFLHLHRTVCMPLWLRKKGLTPDHRKLHILTLALGLYMFLQGLFPCKCLKLSIQPILQW